MLIPSLKRNDNYLFIHSISFFFSPHINLQIHHLGVESGHKVFAGDLQLDVNLAAPESEREEELE